LGQTLYNFDFVLLTDFYFVNIVPYVFIIWCKLF